MASTPWCLARSISCWSPRILLFHPSVANSLLSLSIVGWIDEPDGHSRAGNGVELDGAGETLVTLGIVVLQADLELDGLQEVPLLLILRVLEELLDILAHASYSDG